MTTTADTSLAGANPEEGQDTTTDWEALRASALERGEATGKGATVSACSPHRTGKQRRALRGLGHALKPTVQVGQHGLTQAVAEACDAALEQHELVKVKLNESAPCSREAAAFFLFASVAAETVQIVGRTLLCYRRHPDHPRIALAKSDT